MPLRAANHMCRDLGLNYLTAVPSGFLSHQTSLQSLCARNCVVSLTQPRFLQANELTAIAAADLPAALSNLLALFALDLLRLH